MFARRFHVWAAEPPISCYPGFVVVVVVVVVVVCVTLTGELAIQLPA